MARQVDVAYHYESFNGNIPPRTAPDPDRCLLLGMNEGSGQFPDAEFSLDHRAVIGKRDRQMSKPWKLSQTEDQDRDYFYYEGLGGAGQYVYIVEDAVWDKHPEF
ncbi:hypothetical protein N657DRAFT_636692 [Parathielavia appendiculata]|uniref:Uncharacterized protein n=1 Tax=Parathielavia appendiculata TaxID=2587402 RepID=A0AAN6TT33_9PEZI|nr:hypothetical protein N657DRAFT_636692 [Parathielavia appendiculata]